MTDKLTVGFISLGCAKNQINTEHMIAAVKNAGYNVTGEPEKSDVTVINTCGFIEDAKKEALDTIFEVAALKKENKLQKTLLDIKEKYGKNAILKGMNLEEGGTAIERNGQVGGHKG